MSLIGSLLALVLIPLKARAPEVETKRERELADEVRRLEFALNYWRTAYDALEDSFERQLAKNESLREERDTLARELSDMRRRETDRQFYGYAQMQNQLQAQAMQDVALYQQSQLAAYQGLGQAQGLQNALMCNCVPSRAQVFTPAVNGG
jgi:hypothetical protein